MKPGDGRHLVDDQMIAVYVGAEPRFGRRNRTLHHLQTCVSCARRYEALVQQMGDLRDDAVAEADEIFTPGRLEAQRLEILSRLEHAAHPARVIPFPSHSTPNLSIFTGSQVRRWIAAAAAAGLIIGLTLGRMSDLGTPDRNGGLRSNTPVPGPAQAGRPSGDIKPAEEEILSRVEQAQGGDTLVPAELEALGAMTPIRDVALRLPPRR